MKPLRASIVVSLALLGIASCAEDEPSEFDPDVIEEPPVESDDETR